MAEALFVAENTVKVHVQNILSKLGLRNCQPATAYAVHHGLKNETTKENATDE
ncbi:response regulator transcription factor [Chloroflexota bacterium]